MLDTDTDTDGHDHSSHSEEKAEIWVCLMITIFAGFAAFIGGFSIFCVNPDKLAVIPISLAFSAGIVLYLALMSLIPESAHQFDEVVEDNAALAKFYTLLSVAFGLAFMMATEWSLVHKLGGHSHGHGPPESVGAKSPTDVTHGNGHSTVEMTHQSDPSVSGLSLDKEEVISKQSLSNISYALSFGLLMHHLPEGIATFIALYHDFSFGVLVAFALGIHDVPSGICISVPIYCVTKSRLKAFGVCFIAAVVYPIGGFIGWAIVASDISEDGISTMNGILFGFIGGILLHIGLVELLPQSILAATAMDKQTQSNRMVTIVYVLIFVGLLVMDVSAILLEATGGHEH